MKNTNKKPEVMQMKCPYCDKVISSLSQKQLEYNYQAHRIACEMRTKEEKEVRT